jgi:hypothetical protein
MYHLFSFENFIFEESTPTDYDSTIIPALGKNIYLFLKDKGLNVKLEYQNKSLGEKGISKKLGEKDDYEFLVASFPKHITISTIYGEKFPEDLKSELVMKFSSEDIESKFTPVYQQLTFGLSEVSREWQSSRNRMTSTPRYDLMTKANRSQREKGYSGISKQYRKAID